MSSPTASCDMYVGADADFVGADVDFVGANACGARLQILKGKNHEKESEIQFKKILHRSRRRWHIN